MNWAPAATALLLLSACSTGPIAAGSIGSAERHERRAADATSGRQPGRPDPIDLAQPQFANVQGKLATLPPSILLPAASIDSVIAKAGKLQIHKSQVYDRLAEEQPRLLKGFADHLVFDALLAGEAVRHGIQVDPKQIDEVLDRERKRLRTELKTQLPGQSAAEFFEQRFGMSEEAHWKLQRLLLGRDLYRSYVIRYLALREDRVHVRLMAHRDRKVVDGVATQVGQGAEFKTLALRLSEHPSRRDGGNLPPLTRDDPRPLVARAFELKPGELSPVFVLEAQGVRYHYLLYCVKRLEGRKVAFAEVKAEIDRELIRTPVSPEERKSLHLRLRSRSETLGPAGKDG